MEMIMALASVPLLPHIPELPVLYACPCFRPQLCSHSMCATYHTSVLPPPRISLQARPSITIFLTVENVNNLAVITTKISYTWCWENSIHSIGHWGSQQYFPMPSSTDMHCCPRIMPEPFIPSSKGPHIIFHLHRRSSVHKIWLIRSGRGDSSIKCIDIQVRQ